MNAEQVLKDKGYVTQYDNKPYGFFGYQSAGVHRAIGEDDADALKAIIGMGWITADSKTLDNLTMQEFCERKGAKRCAEIFQ